MENVDTITSSEMRFILRLMEAIEKVGLDCEIWPTGVIEIHYADEMLKARSANV